MRIQARWVVEDGERRHSGHITHISSIPGCASRSKTHCDFGDRICGLKETSCDMRWIVAMRIWQHYQRQRYITAETSRLAQIVLHTLAPIAAYEELTTRRSSKADKNILRVALTCHKPSLKNLSSSSSNQTSNSQSGSTQ